MALPAKDRKRRLRDPARTMGVRFTDAERAAIEATAAALDVAPSALIRAAALGAARVEPALLAQEAVAVHRAAGALGAIGRNLNQIVRALNERRDVEVDDLMAMFGDLLQRVEESGRAHRALVTAHAQRGRLARSAAVSGAS
ncbi:MAG: plasmid mobilization relaxosome protein MobC [Hyphomonadaceae bacterium]|nr:plasmid mobilization relaxosome protein MobC [Hyphomonadaceae bacterium]